MPRDSHTFASELVIRKESREARRLFVASHKESCRACDFFITDCGAPTARSCRTRSARSHGPATAKAHTHSLHNPDLSHIQSYHLHFLYPPLAQRAQDARFQTHQRTRRQPSKRRMRDFRHTSEVGRYAAELRSVRFFYNRLRSAYGAELSDAERAQSRHGDSQGLHTQPNHPFFNPPRYLSLIISM